MPWTTDCHHLVLLAYGIWAVGPTLYIYMLINDMERKECFKTPYHTIGLKERLKLCSSNAVRGTARCKAKLALQGLSTTDRGERPS